MGDGAAGCQVKAGVLKPDETLTDNARHQFIKEVIEEIRFGTPDLPMVCLDKIDGIGIAGVPDDLYDRDKYPSFHANYVDTYEKIAAALNVAGSIAFPPLFDFSVSIPNFDFPSIGIDFNAFFDLPGLPALAAKLPSLAPKFPNVKLPDLPKLPIPPKIPIPDLKLPDINLMPDLYFKFSAILKLPDFALSLIIPPPVFLPKIPTLDLSDICKKVKENVLPESPGAKGTGVNLLEIAAISVLTRKISQCLTITIVACLFGAGSFLCGGLGQKLNVAPEPEPEPEPLSEDGNSQLTTLAVSLLNVALPLRNAVVTF